MEHSLVKQYMHTSHTVQPEEIFHHGHRLCEYRKYTQLITNPNPIRIHPELEFIPCK